MQRWRHLAIGNTVAGAVVCVLALIFLPRAAAAAIAALMALGVADTWYLDRRYRRTGRLLR